MSTVTATRTETLLALVALMDELWETERPGTHDGQAAAAVGAVIREFLDIEPSADHCWNLLTDNEARAASGDPEARAWLSGHARARALLA